ncbi:hypothetical protein H4R34_000991 [Dimargaris verticillata]|uniref:Fumarylacetoacetase-like C-terminal domain-containing protein n=1 Tax=Dimargaris verticillata TaxID=2761393 RepID=A0A9W8EFE1_9FUNG|nr:hypothetical protein H4R34_000991 [Dimargaris verticillata]
MVSLRTTALMTALLVTMAAVNTTASPIQGHADATPAIVKRGMSGGSGSSASGTGGSAFWAFFKKGWDLYNHFSPRMAIPNRLPSTMRNFVSAGRKIVAIGRNYRDHALELGNQIPKAPFFFLKPTSSYVEPPAPIEIPRGCNVHHEVELGVVIGQTGRDISEAHADDYIAGYALALDLTARNMQAEAKKQGLPWSAAKGFDTFTPISAFIDKAHIPEPHRVRLWCSIDGVTKQDGWTSDMMFQIPQLLAHVSSIMTLEAGDVILTGTPKGVGPILPGETIDAGLAVLDPDGHETTLAEMSFPAVSRQGLFSFTSEAAKL